MKRTNLAWPSSWADLEKDHLSVSSELGGISPLGEIEKVVKIDFQFRPREFLLQGCKPLPKVIAPIAGDSFHWSGEEPNGLVAAWICSNRDGSINR